MLNMTSWYRFPRYNMPVVGSMSGLTPAGQPMQTVKQKGKGKKVNVTLVSPTAAEDARQKELAKKKKQKKKTKKTF